MAEGAGFWLNEMTQQGQMALGFALVVSIVALIVGIGVGLLKSVDYWFP